MIEEIKTIWCNNPKKAEPLIQIVKKVNELIRFCNSLEKKEEPIEKEGVNIVHFSRWPGICEMARIIESSGKVDCIIMDEEVYNAYDNTLRDIMGVRNYPKLPHLLFRGIKVYKSSCSNANAVEK